MTGLIRSPLFAVALTFLVYHLAQRLYGRFHLALFNPVMVSIAVLIVILRTTGLDYQTYNQGGKLISFFLGPAVVALGAPLYRQIEEIRKQGRAMLISLAVGSVVGVLSAALTARLLGAPVEVVASLAPKSVTTPIAMGIAAKIGGLEPLTAALVIATGILGAVAGPAFLRLIGVRSPTAFGLAMGAASHGIGTARAVEEGELQGAAAGLAICLNGLATALITPFLMWLIM